MSRRTVRNGNGRTNRTNLGASGASIVSGRSTFRATMHGDDFQKRLVDSRGRSQRSASRRLGTDRSEKIAEMIVQGIEQRYRSPSCMKLFTTDPHKRFDAPHLPRVDMNSSRSEAFICSSLSPGSKHDINRATRVRGGNDDVRALLENRRAGGAHAGPRSAADVQLERDAAKVERFVERHPDGDMQSFGPEFAGKTKEECKAVLRERGGIGRDPEKFSAYMFMMENKECIKISRSSEQVADSLTGPQTGRLYDPTHRREHSTRGLAQYM